MTSTLRPPLRRLLLPVALGLAAVVAVGFALAPSAREGDPVAAAEATAEPVPFALDAPGALAAHPRPTPARAARVAMVAFAPGDRLRWTVEAHTQARLAVVADVPGVDAIAAVADAARIAMSVTGTLQLRVYASQQDGLLAGMSLEDAVVESQGGVAHGSTSSDLRDVLRAEVLATLAADGRVTSLAFPPEVDADARAIWRDVAARWQVARPPTADAATWQADEVDPSGAHVATYRRFPGPAGVVAGDLVEKRKTATRAGVEIVGTTELLLGRRAERLVWQEQVTMRPSAAFEARVDASFHGRAVLVADELDPGLLAQAPERLARASRWGASPLAATDAVAGVADERALPDAATAIAALEEAWGGAGDVTAERDDRLTRLVRVLAASDAAVARVVERLRDPALPEEVAAAFAGALAAAGTAPSARALAVVLADAGVSPSARYAAIVATALHAAPVREVDLALRAVIDADRAGPLAGAALLARGSVAEAARATDPSWHADVVAALSAEAAAAADPERLALAMEALGNASPETPPAVVRQAMASGDAERRVAALRGLRNTRDATALALLTAAYATDPDEAVRAGALAIVSEDGHPLRCEALAAVTARDPSEALRQVAQASRSETPTACAGASEPR